MEPIAVVGVGCVLPGTASLEEFWQHLRARRVLLTPVPSQRWDHALYLDPDASVPDRTHCNLGGFVSDFVFDWRKFKVPPTDARTVNPLQWMILQAGAQALEAAGTLPRERTAILLGSTGLGWQKDSGIRIRLDDMLDAVRSSAEFGELPRAVRDSVLEKAASRLTSRLSEVSEDNVVGASASVAAGRINMHFDLRGPHYAVDAGFASSLAALDLAVRGLRDGEFDLALAGGASELLSPLELVAFSKLGGLSQGTLQPFDQAADGTVLGEGVALFALKRLSDAQRDGNVIRALVRGVGGASDGRGRSLVAPRPEGQALAMRRAYEDTGDLTPAQVGYVECHATGTVVGDASEVAALSAVYQGAPARSVALGSVKANIGHLRGAAGAAGLLRAILALEKREIPPQASFQEASPRLELNRTPFFIPTEATPFPQGRPAVAVSAFSFGGNSYHAVLEPYDARPPVARPAPRAPSAEPLAIVGMGGVFPGASDLPEFWSRLLEGYDRTGTVPAERYDIDRYVDPSAQRRDKAYTRLGCFLDTLPTPMGAMRVPPSAWASVDPSHVLAFQVAEQALADAGFHPDRWDRDRVALSLAFLPYQGKKFLADTRMHWEELAHELRRALDEQPLPAGAREAILRSAERQYKAGLPAITEDTLTGYMGSLNAGRIAWAHDFHGPHFVVDSACASGHAAVHAAAKLLHHRKADVVLAGGVWCDMMPEFFIAACRFNALSSNGSFPFDQRADGFIPGEGAGMLVLKRLADAERDGDRIRAVVRAVAGSSDGKGRSVLAPTGPGEAAAIRGALAAAQVEPASVGYVECHGTGTALGDVTEAAATAEVYGVGRERPLSIGSVKSNIGHLNAAAGIAGMIKAALAVESGVLPASIKCETPNPKLPPQVTVVQKVTPWAQAGGQPRRAGVNSFGVGGSNFHAILEEYQPASAPRLFAASGPSLRSALELLERDGWTQAGEAGRGDHRLALTARSQEELRQKLKRVHEALQADRSLDFLSQVGIFAAGPESPLRGKRIAVLFPGQGGQYPNMARELAAAYPVVQRTLDDADRLYKSWCGRPLTASFFADRPESFVQRDEDIHAAVFVVNVALHRLLVEQGIQPDLLIGQSAGELAALVAAGSLSFEDGLKAIRARTLAVLDLNVPEKGRMVALSCPAEEVPSLVQGLPGYSALAADNGPRACIVSLETQALEGLVERCRSRDIECTVLPVSHGYHSRFIAGAQKSYGACLAGLAIQPPRAELISTVEARAGAADHPDGIRALLLRQLVEPVQLTRAIRLAHERGARIFLEAGPKWSLTQFTREILKDQPHGAIACIHPKVGELEQFLRLRAFCFVHSPNSQVAMSKLAHQSVSEVPARSAGDALWSLPLTGVLSPESALRVAAALGRRFNVDASRASAADLQTFDTIAAFVQRLVDGQGPAAPSPAPSRVTEAEVQRVLLATVVQKTGYPEEMLGLDLDLEADLGIDTVKQVDVFATVRAHFGVPRDPNLQLRDFNTLRKVVGHLVERVQAHGARAPAPSAPAVASAPPAAHAPAPAPGQTQDQVREVLVRIVVEKTGYPEEMLGLDLDLEADLGIDTVKQVEVFARTREHFGISRDPKRALREFNTLRKVIDHLTERMVASGQIPGPVSTHRSGNGGPGGPGGPTGPSGPGGPGGTSLSVRETLLRMELDRDLGLTEQDKRRLAEALSAKLGVAAPDSARVRTLEELVQSVRPRS